MARYGYVVRESLMALDLSPSPNFSPIAFIMGENKNYNNEVHQTVDRHTIYGLLPAKEQSTQIIFWEDCDEHRENFENSILFQYEELNLPHGLITSIPQLLQYLNLCSVMERAQNIEELDRIFYKIWQFVSTNPANLDSSIVLKIFKTVCLHNDGIVRIFRSIASNDANLRYFLYHMKQLNNNDWGVWPGGNGYFTMHNLIAMLFNDENSNAINTLIEYGAQQQYSEDVFISWLVEQEYHLLDTERAFLAQQLCIVLKSNIVEDHKALQLIWRAIPDPYISEIEIQQYALFLGADLPWVVENYRTLNPNSSYKKPRSLKHLSRCVVRGKLSENFRLPEGVSSLNIPPIIKNYLWLEY